MASRSGSALFEGFAALVHSREPAALIAVSQRIKPEASSRRASGMASDTWPLSVPSGQPPQLACVGLQPGDYARPQRLDAVEVGKLWLHAARAGLGLVLDHRQDEGVLVLEVVVELRALTSAAALMCSECRGRARRA